MSRNILLLLVSFFVSLTPASATETPTKQMLDRAIIAIQQNDCPSALSRLNYVASFNLIGSKLEGQDLLSPKGDISSAQSMLGIFYFDGVCVPQNYREAHRLLTRSLEHGESIVTRHSLGEMYYRGLGVKKDYEVAKAYYLDSVISIIDPANILADIYERGGFGVDRNLLRSYMWASIAATHWKEFGLSKPSKMELDKRLLSIEKKLSASDLKDAQSMAHLCEEALYTGGTRRHERKAIAACENK